MCFTLFQVRLHLQIYKFGNLKLKICNVSPGGMGGEGRGYLIHRGPGHMPSNRVIFLTENSKTRFSLFPAQVSCLEDIPAQCNKFLIIVVGFSCIVICIKLYIKRLMKMKKMKKMKILFSEFHSRTGIMY